MFLNNAKAKAVRNTEIGEFAHKHKDLLLIVADPKDDTIFVAYDDKYAGGKIKSAKGGKLTIVRDVLRSASFERSINDFLVGLAEVIGLKKLMHGNNFLQFIDGALYNIAMRHRLNFKKSRPETPAMVEQAKNLLKV